MASLKELDNTLDNAEEDLRELLDEVGKARDTNDPAVKTRIIRRLQEQMVRTARKMPFPIHQLN